MNQDKLLTLIAGYNADQLTPEQNDELMSWAKQDLENYHLFMRLTDQRYIANELKGWRTEDTATALQRIKGRIGQSTTRRFGRTFLIASAIISTFIALGISIYVNRKEQQQVYLGEQAYTVASTIRPGADRATLTLDNGKVIDLTTLENGNVIAENGVRISKDGHGQIVYEAVANNDTKARYNTITTPRGGQYQVMLPDGTKVWLNAASYLHYPTSMNQGKREVELVGEAYFEVAHDKSKPFIVVTPDQNVEVLGTHFNISSYSDDLRTITTLTEGSVKVSNQKKQQRILTPGQQSVGNSEVLNVKTADMEQALAWRNNLILFRSATLQDILKQASRWYNIDVEYKGHISEEPITGGISRTDNLDVLLRVLQLSGVSYEIRKEGGKYQLTIIGK